jgi:8-oxo-dGTP pyrophosphatase MutT (NUDIX family)
MSKLRPWPVTHTTEVLKNRIFRVTERRSLSPRTGEAHDFWVLESTDWVNVVPLTAGREVVMVRQYRHGRQEVTLEIPGGMVDAGDRDPGAAAARELLEETGYRAGRVERLGAIAPNPAIHDNLCHSYLATDLAYVGPQKLDGTEEIEVLKVPLREIPALIREGQITHSLVVVAFAHLLGLGGPPVESGSRS